MLYGTWLNASGGILPALSCHASGSVISPLPLGAVGTVRGAVIVSVVMSPLANIGVAGAGQTYAGPSIIGPPLPICVPVGSNVAASCVYVEKIPPRLTVICWNRFAAEPACISNRNEPFALLKAGKTELLEARSTDSITLPNI